MHRLRDLSRPEHLFELRHGDLAHGFPSLRSLRALPNNLFVSRATVKTHLSHIYAKLDVVNRTELAALAATQRRLS